MPTSHREVVGLRCLRWRDSAAGGAVRSPGLYGREEVLHRRHSALLQISAVAPAVDADKALRLGRGRIQPLAESKGNGAIVRAMQDQERRPHFLDDVERAELVQHEPA